MKVRTLNHIAIIPDGNRRWAKKRGLPTFFGHKEGFRQAINLSKKTRELGIKVLTFWAFSTENWQRSKQEIEYLMNLFKQMIDENLKTALREEIRIIHLGRKERINEDLKKKIEEAEKKTERFNKYYLAIGLDYGGRDEILRAIEKIINEKLKIENLNGEIFGNFLDTRNLPYPEPDLIIRTSGEKRTSGFMIWQSTYSEWIFHQKLFPDFTPNDLEKCVFKYYQRQRRFGK